MCFSGKSDQPYQTSVGVPVLVILVKAYNTILVGGPPFYRPYTYSWIYGETFLNCPGRE